MKLAFSTLASPGWSWQKTIEAATAYGYTGIEWRLIDGETVSPDFPIERCREIRREVEAAGLLTCALDSGASLAHAAGPDRERNLNEAKALLHLAQALGTDILRVFPGKYAESVSDEQAVQWMAEGLRELLPVARETGVRIALELHDSFEWNRKKLRGTTTSSLLVRLLQEIPDPEVGIQWDLGNPYQEGESAAETWRNIDKARLIYVHMKDIQQTPAGDWQYVRMGAGIIPIPDVVQWLRGAGFDGWISYEWEKKWHPELAEPEEALPQYLNVMQPLVVR